MSVRTLFLDLASNAQMIACIADGKIAAKQSIESKAGEEQLMPAIETMLRAAGCTLGDLTRIAAVTGPGGFMSLRVGISLANALSDGLGIPLAGVHLSDLFAARVGKDERCLWVHSTKREQLFVRALGKGAEGWKEPTLETVEALTAMLAVPIGYVGELIESQRAALPNLHPLPNVKPLDAVLPEAIDRLTYAKKPLEPWYGRGA